MQEWNVQKQSYSANKKIIFWVFFSFYGIEFFSLIMPNMWNSFVLKRFNSYHSHLSIWICYLFFLLFFYHFLCVDEISTNNFVIYWTMTQWMSINVNWYFRLKTTIFFAVLWLFLGFFWQQRFFVFFPVRNFLIQSQFIAVKRLIFKWIEDAYDSLALMMR